MNRVEEWVCVASELEEVKVVQDSDPLEYCRDASVALYRHRRREKYREHYDASDMAAHRVNRLLGLFIELALHLGHGH